MFINYNAIDFLDGCDDDNSIHRSEEVSTVTAKDILTKFHDSGLLQNSKYNENSKGADQTENQR
jgi:hypothetical protein